MLAREEDIVMRIATTTAGLGLRRASVGVVLTKVSYHPKYKRTMVKGTFVISGWQYQLVRIGNDTVDFTPLSRVCAMCNAQTTPYEMAFVAHKCNNEKLHIFFCTIELSWTPQAEQLLVQYKEVFGCLPRPKYHRDVEWLSSELEHWKKKQAPKTPWGKKRSSSVVAATSQPQPKRGHKDSPRLGRSGFVNFENPRETMETTLVIKKNKKNQLLNKELFKYEYPRWIFGVVEDYTITNLLIGSTVTVKEGQAKIVNIVDGEYHVKVGKSKEVEFFDEKGIQSFFNVKAVFEYIVKWGDDRKTTHSAQALKPLFNPLHKNDGVVTTFEGEDPLLFSVEYRCIKHDSKKKLWVYAIRVLKENKDGTWIKTKQLEFVPITDFTPVKITPVRIGKKIRSFELDEPRFW
jgi:hypothetical protein